MARKDTLKQLRKTLMRRREALVKALAGDNSLLREIAETSSGDVVDFALGSASGEVNSRLAEAESKELAHVQHALEKMDEGTYGKCEACNCNIPLARLEILPYATLCIACKRSVEQGRLMGNSNGVWVHQDDASFGDLDANIS